MFLRFLKIEKIQNTFIGVLALFPICFSGYLILEYGVNVPFGDEWEIVGLYKNIKENGINFNLFFVQHNEHRIFFPRIVLLVIAMLTKWNVVAQMLVSQGLLIGVLFIFYKYLATRRSKEALILIIPIVPLIFSLRQWENMFWGFQVGFYMVYTFTILSFYLYERFENTKIRKYLYVCWITAFIASFSSIHGLLVWICYGILFLLIRILEHRKLSKEQYITLAVGCTSWAIYFLNYNKPLHHPSLAQGGIADLFTYYILSLGGSFFWWKTPALIFGVILTLLLILTATCVISKKSILDHRFPVLIIFFSIAVLGAISLGRSGFGELQGLSSRYSTYSLLIPISLHLIFINKVILKKAIFLLYIVAITASFVNIPAVKSHSNSRQYAKYVLENFAIMPNTERIAYFPVENDYYLTILPEFLKSENLSVFAGRGKEKIIPGIVFEEDSRPRPNKQCFNPKPTPGSD